MATTYINKNAAADAAALVGYLFFLLLFSICQSSSITFKVFHNLIKK